MSSDVSLFESDGEKSQKYQGAIDCLNESDIIAETPQKVKKKKRQKTLIKTGKSRTTTTAEIQNCTSSSTQHYVSKEFCVTRNDTEITNLCNTGAKNLNVRYKSPYVFYEIEEVLAFTEFCHPLNVSMKFVGIYKQNRINVHYLLEHRQNCAKILPRRILIDFDLLNSFPAADQAVEIYGFVKFCKRKTTCFPIIVVKFWANINSDFDRYLKCMRQQKLYVPICYKKTTNFCINECKEMEINRSVDYSFEEIAESCLHKNVERLEQICDEVDQIMKISEDVFV